LNHLLIHRYELEFRVNVFKYSRLKHSKNLIYLYILKKLLIEDSKRGKKEMSRFAEIMNSEDFWSIFIPYVLGYLDKK